MNRQLALLMVLWGSLLIACGAPATAPEPLSTAPPPLQTPTSVSAATATRPAGGPVAIAVRAARQLLISRLGQESEPRVVSITETDWPNTALGCEEPGMAYAEVITAGYVIDLEAKGKRYSVHTDRQGNAVMCDKGASAGDEQPELAPGAEKAVRAARQELSSSKGIQPELIELASVQQRQWSDSSLGCPKPGMMYLQVITPGYLVKLAAEGKDYRVHTDTRGNAVVCERSNRKP